MYENGFVHIVKRGRGTGSSTWEGYKEVKEEQGYYISSPSVEWKILLRPRGVLSLPLHERWRGISESDHALHPCGRLFKSVPPAGHSWRRSRHPPIFCPSSSSLFMVPRLTLFAALGQQSFSRSLARSRAVEEPGRAPKSIAFRNHRSDHEP